MPLFPHPKPSHGLSTHQSSAATPYDTRQRSLCFLVSMSQGSRLATFHPSLSEHLSGPQKVSGCPVSSTILIARPFPHSAEGCLPPTIWPCLCLHSGCSYSPLLAQHPTLLLWEVPIAMSKALLGLPPYPPPSFILWVWLRGLCSKRPPCSLLLCSC